MSALITFILRILRSYCDPDLWESVEGDLNEMHALDLQRKGSRVANWKLIFNAVAFLRYRRLRKRQFKNSQNNMDLFFNYLKVGFREVRRQKPRPRIRGKRLGLDQRRSKSNGLI